jgi:DNA-binding transcriptional LysR family regulator
MDFKIKLLRYFVTVAEEGTITRASEKLHVAQPSLSLRIRALEELLGFDLFERQHGQIALSDMGRAFLPEARKLVAEAQRLDMFVRDLRQGHSGHLRMGASQWSMDQPERTLLIEDFTEKYPKIEVTVMLGFYSPAFLDGLAHGELDLAVITGPVLDSSFEQIVIRRLDISVLLPIELPAATLDPLPPESLSGLSVAWYRRENNPAMYDQVVPLLTQSAHVSLIAPPDTYNAALVRYARSNRVPALVWADQEFDFDDMVHRRLAIPPIQVDWSLVRSRVEHGPAAALYWRYAQAAIGKVPRKD